MSPVPILSILNDSQCSVICLQCKEPVGESQEKLGKAYCQACEAMIFGVKFESRHTTMDEPREQKKETERQVFLHTMGRFFRRMRS